MARKGVAGISGIGRTIENFQTTFVGSGLDTKIYARRETNENEARKGKKRPNEDQDHPKTKLKHMVSFSFFCSTFDLDILGRLRKERNNASACTRSASTGGWRYCS